MYFSDLQDFSDDGFLNDSVNWLNNLLGISLYCHDHLFSIRRRNFLDKRDSLLDLHLHYSFFSIHHLNYLFDGLYDIHWPIYGVSDSNWNLFLHLDDLRNVDEVVNDSLDLNKSNLVDRDLLDHLDFLDVGDLSHNFNQPFLEPVDDLNLFLSLGSNHWNLLYNIHWNLCCERLDYRSVNMYKFGLDNGNLNSNRNLHCSLIRYDSVNYDFFDDWNFDFDLLSN